MRLVDLQSLSHPPSFEKQERMGKKVMGRRRRRRRSRHRVGSLFQTRFMVRVIFLSEARPADERQWLDGHKLSAHDVTCVRHMSSQDPFCPHFRENVLDDGPLFDGKAKNLG